MRSSVYADDRRSPCADRLPRYDRRVCAQAPYRRLPSGEGLALLPNRWSCCETLSTGSRASIRSRKTVALRETAARLQWKIETDAVVQRKPVRLSPNQPRRLPINCLVAPLFAERAPGVAFDPWDLAASWTDTGAHQRLSCAGSPMLSCARRHLRDLSPVASVADRLRVERRMTPTKPSPGYRSLPRR